MEEDEPTGYVTWAKFSAVTSEILGTKYPTRDDEETLFRAFKAMDTENKGYLEPDELRKYMTTMGEIFTKDEIDEMLAVRLGNEGMHRSNREQDIL
jgi:Ca2+-binding EF-hand superfamily protein